jgi:hypothetical protein
MRASEYGIANLKRILPNLITWTYQELEDYSDLNELYNQVLAQWNRYMGHVATYIGGAVQTRMTYAQGGPVYEFVPKADQRRAMQFLNEQAFAPPTWIIDEDILQRIENVGTVERMRSLQVRTLNRVLNPGRMQRLIENEARNGREAYSLGEMMDDLRSGVWTELQTGGAINVYRRNLQRGYLERMEWLMTAEVPPVTGFLRNYSTTVDVPQSDIRAYTRAELVTIDRQVQQALNRRLDAATRIHLRDVRERIAKILDPED